MDLRLKPKLSVQRTQKMITYFRTEDGLAATRGIPLKSMVPLDNMQEMNLQANMTASAPLSDLLKMRPSSVSLAQGSRTVRPPSAQELNILDAKHWFMRKKPVEPKPSEELEVKSSNSLRKPPAVREAVRRRQEEKAHQAAKLDPDIH